MIRDALPGRAHGVLQQIKCGYRDERAPASRAGYRFQSSVSRMICSKSSKDFWR